MVWGLCVPFRKFFFPAFDTYSTLVSQFLICKISFLQVFSPALFPPVKWSSKLLKIWIGEPCMTEWRMFILFISFFFSLCEACQNYYFQIVYVLVAEMLFWKTVSETRNTGKLRNTSSEVQHYSYVNSARRWICRTKQNPYQRAVMVCIEILFLIVSLKIHVLNCILFVCLSFQIDFLLGMTFISPEKSGFFPLHK